MTMQIKAAEDKDWRFCPECHSEIVGAVENGFKVEDIYTDLMVCYDCKSLYVVLPEYFFKGKPKRWREYPKDITVEISDALTTEKAELIKQYELTRATINAIREKEENRS